MWKPIQALSDLPILGTRENANLDFKAVPAENEFEIAKDIASFANAAGGSLVVGAAGGDHLEKWLPLTSELSRDTQRRYELAVRDRCRPAPRVATTEIEMGGGFVLVANVWPFPGQVVGVRLKQGEVRCGSKEPEGVYFFPQRVGTHTLPILPEHLPMYLDARLRRIVIHLEQAVGGKAILIATKYQLKKSKWVQPAHVQSVDILSNSVTVSVHMDHAHRSVPIPLDAIETVSRSIDGWHIYLSGILTTVHSSSPALANFQTYFDPLG
jgi:hypothetical protein